MIIGEIQRKHSCCFTGHRPQKLSRTEAEVKQDLEHAIGQAIDDGFVTFITGMAPGVDIWAGQIVLRLRKENPALHLIAAVPFKGMEYTLSPAWQNAFNDLLSKANIVEYIRPKYSKAVYQIRDKWMVNRSARVIAVYDGAHGGTQDTIEYAKKSGIDCVLAG